MCISFGLKGLTKLVIKFRSNCSALLKTRETLEIQSAANSKAGGCAGNENTCYGEIVWVVLRSRERERERRKVEKSDS